MRQSGNDPERVRVLFSNGRDRAQNGPRSADRKEGMEIYTRSAKQPRRGREAII